MELYIQNQKIFDSGVNELTLSNVISDSTKIWIVNQWTNYYVYIISGDGAGQIALITSNDEDKLFFDTLEKPLNNNSIYEIADFKYQRVEMFQDEKVSVTSTIQNYSDIGKLFTDYSQSFTIPASPTNNAIFSHWYDNAVDNGYDARIRYNAFIEIDTIPFRQGNVQLEKANKKNGYIESYTLTFYGNLTQLKDKFGDDKLNALDYTSLNHVYDSLTVWQRIKYNYEVNYPLIGNNRKLEYLTGTTSDITTNAGAIKWNDLFPSVQVKKIFDFIQTKYGITFTGNFLNYGQFDKLYMFMKNSELPRAYNAGVFFDYYRITGTATFPEYNQVTNVITTDWNSGYFITGTSPFPVYGGNRRILFKFKVEPASAYTSTIYRVDLFQDDVIIKTFENLVGTTDNYIFDIKQSDDAASHKYKIKVSALGAFDFKSRIAYVRRNTYGDRTTDCYNYATSGSPTGQSFIAMQDIVNYVPDIKVADFFMGIVKMFNLIITPINATTFKLEPLELYYQAGQIKDLTPYIYADELDIEKPKLFKSIEFSYEKSENILNDKYSGLFNKQYGDLLFDSGSNSESGKYEIKLPFEDVMWEKTTGYDFQTATLWNKDLQSYTPKPILMYKNDSTIVPTAIKVTTETSSVYNTTLNYIRFNNDIPLGGTDLGYVNTLNWNAEVSSWYLTVAPDGLYKRHYEQYIANLYNQKTRVLKVKAKLEPRNLTKLKLNDRIIIRDNRYIINSFTTDLTNGEATFELINDYRVLGYNSIGYRYSNIELLSVDNTAQDIQIDIYKGMFKLINVYADATGFVTWADDRNMEDDFSTIISIAQNTTRAERIKNFEIEFEDYDGNIVLVEIPVIQDL